MEFKIITPAGHFEIEAEPWDRAYDLIVKAKYVARLDSRDVIELAFEGEVLDMQLLALSLPENATLDLVATGQSV